MGHLTRLASFPERLIIFPKCVLCKATISCMTFHLKFFFRKVKNEKLEKTRNFMLEKVRYFVICDVIGVGKISKKYFLKSFFHSRNFKKNFMTIGLLEKKLEGGGQIAPPPAMRSLGKQPA